VDDNADIVESMAMFLRFYGYEVDTAYNGLAALKIASIKRPDVVLLDISMPGMTGFEVAREMRIMFRDEVWLVAITANSFGMAPERFFDAGFDRYYIKPVDPTTVTELLRELADSRKP
jgi:CheY-like chemotaxis protein